MKNHVWNGHGVDWKLGMCLKQTDGGSNESVDE